MPSRHFTRAARSPILVAARFMRRTGMVMAQDEPPVVAGVATDAAFREGSRPVILSNALMLSDADDIFLEGATVRVTAGLEVSDRLTVGGLEYGSSAVKF